MAAAVLQFVEVVVVVIVLNGKVFDGSKAVVSGGGG